jgi:hypothetical protein
MTMGGESIVHDSTEKRSWKTYAKAHLVTEKFFSEKIALSFAAISA